MSSFSEAVQISASESQEVVPCPAQSIGPGELWRMLFQLEARKAFASQCRRVIAGIPESSMG
jgi:hypothetical protein